jgi:hypothetical protein
MNLEKHNRSLTLACPGCGGKQYSYPDDQTPEPKVLTCTSCGQKTTKDALIQANQVAITVQVERMKADVLQDVQSELKTILSKAFGGTKNIKLKL